MVCGNNKERFNKISKREGDKQRNHFTDDFNSRGKYDCKADKI